MSLRNAWRYSVLTLLKKDKGSKLWLECSQGEPPCNAARQRCQHSPSGSGMWSFPVSVSETAGRVSSVQRIPSREWYAHFPNASQLPSAKSCFGKHCQRPEFLVSIGKKLSHCCNSSKAAVTYIHEYTHMYMPTFVHVCTHLYLPSCAYTQRYMLIHSRIPHTPCGIEKCWFPKARSLAKWTSPPQLGCAATVTSLSSQLLIQALWDSKPELHRYMLCLNGSRVFAWM